MVSSGVLSLESLLPPLNAWQAAAVVSAIAQGPLALAAAGFAAARAHAPAVPVPGKTFGKGVPGHILFPALAVGLAVIAEFGFFQYRLYVHNVAVTPGADVVLYQFPTIFPYLLIAPAFAIGFTVAVVATIIWRLREGGHIRATYDAAAATLSGIVDTSIVIILFFGTMQFFFYGVTVAGTLAAYPDRVEVRHLFAPPTPHRYDEIASITIRNSTRGTGSKSRRTRYATMAFKDGSTWDSDSCDPAIWEEISADLRLGLKLIADRAKVPVRL